MRNDTAIIEVRYEAGCITILGGHHQCAAINAHLLLHQLVERSPARCVDFLAIATGVYVMDRIVKRNPQPENEAGRRSLSVRFEVVDDAFWGRAHIIDRFEEMLGLLTGDFWAISFSRRLKSYEVQPQESFPIGRPDVSRVALFSGGLDSAAGLATRMMTNPANYLLLTVGHQSAMRKHCRQQLARFHDLVPHWLAIPAAFSVHLKKGASLSMRKQEQTQRARGMLFGSAGALLANACNIEQVEVFESGVGAVNLPLVEGALGEGYSTRGAQPGFLRQLGELASLVFERPISFVLPFLNCTKAEVISTISPFPELAQWLLQSRSCIHSSLRVPRKRHCGVCPACIERRQALLVGSIVEDIDDYETDIFAIARQKRSAYFQIYAENAFAWRNGDERVRERLHRHRILSDFKQLSSDFLEELLLRHAHEVRRVYEDASAC